MWGFIRLIEAGVQAQLNHTKYIRVRTYICDAPSVQITPPSLHRGK